MIFKDIMRELRNKVGDQQAKKFDDPRLVNVISRVLNSINQKFKVKLEKTYISVSAYQESVQMPSDFFYLYTVFQRRQRIPIYNSPNRSKTYKSTEKTISGLYTGELGFGHFDVYPLLEEPSSSCVILDSTETVSTVDLDSVERIIYIDDVFYLLYNDTSMSDPDNLPDYAIELTYAGEFLEVFYYADITPSALEEEIQNFPSIYTNFLLNKCAAELMTDDNRQENVQKATLFEQKAAMDLRDLQHYAQSNYVNSAKTTGYNSVFD